MSGLEHGYTGRAAAAVRRFVTAIVFTIAGLSFAFGFGNGWRLGLQLGVPAWIAPLVAPAVDLSVVGLLVAINFVRSSGIGVRLVGPRLLLVGCGVATVGLNVTSPILDRQVGRACFDAVAPLLLIGWSEVGPRLLALMHSTGPYRGRAVESRPSTTSASARIRRGPYRTDADLLVAAEAAELEYRTQYGKPITRDELRKVLRVSGGRATAVLRALRERSAST